MNCPACRASLATGQDACPACGATLAPPVEGSLAPVPAKSLVEPLRHLPGLRRRERTWKDEVRDRVKKRRAERTQDAPLPLFDEPAEAASPSEPEQREESQQPPAAPATEPVALEVQRDAEAALAGDVAVRSTPEPSDVLAELPLRRSGGSPEPVPQQPAGDEDEIRASAAAHGEVEDVEAMPKAAREWRRKPLAAASDDDPEDFAARGPEADGTDPDWSFEPTGLEARATPLERPSSPAERALAATLDSLALTLLWAAVVYFAGRAARVPLAALLAAWPWLVGYLLFLALAYAAFFTGATGQTPGKIATGQRVVDRAGRPPGFLRALGRACLGLVGTFACGLGLLPILFDPARRALHDRAFGTRVVRW